MQKSLVHKQQGIKKRQFQNLNLLDLGCDNGLYTIILANKFKKLIGMDNSVSSINKTHETTLWYHRHFAKFSHQNISLNLQFYKKNLLK